MAWVTNRILEVRYTTLRCVTLR